MRATVTFISVRAANAVTRTYVSFWNRPPSHCVLRHEVRICFAIYDSTYFGRNALPGLLRNCNYLLNMDIEHTILAQINFPKNLKYSKFY